MTPISGTEDLSENYSTLKQGKISDRSAFRQSFSSRWIMSGSTRRQWENIRNQILSELGYPRYTKISPAQAGKFRNSGDNIIIIFKKGKMMRKLLVALVTFSLFVSPAFAADWNFYGSARVSTFYSKIDNDMFNGSADTKNFEQNLQGNSRIGARVKVSDELKGAFEYGAKGGNANIRLLYGEWNFGAGKLIVGQAYTPFLVVTNQAYNLSLIHI